MTVKPKIDLKTIKKKLSIRKPWDNVIIFILNLLIAIPVFIIIHQNVVDPDMIFHLDRILLFIVILAVIQIILRLMRTVIIICIALYLVVLLYGSTIGNYGFGSVYEDYRSMIYTMADDANPQDIIISKLLPFPNKSKIIAAVEFENPAVRNFALSATTKYFRNVKGYHKYRRIIQSFAIFKFYGSNNFRFIGKW